jgi:niacin transporter
MKVRELTLGGLYGAITLLIILVFSQFLKVSIPPFFTATLLLHVPLFLSMLVSPSVAAMVGVVSAAGFAMTPLGPVVAMRALMHAPVGYIGGCLTKRGYKYPVVLAITLPIHAALEAVVVVAFMGMNAKALSYAITVVGLGTAIHHMMTRLLQLLLLKSWGKEWVRKCLKRLHKSKK